MSNIHWADVDSNGRYVLKKTIKLDIYAFAGAEVYGRRLAFTQ
jgi:hypothetical protein